MSCTPKRSYRGRLAHVVRGVFLQRRCQPTPARAAQQQHGGGVLGGVDSDIDENDDTPAKLVHSCHVLARDTGKGGWGGRYLCLLFSHRCPPVEAPPPQGADA